MIIKIPEYFELRDNYFIFQRYYLRTFIFCWANNKALDLRYTIKGKYQGICCVSKGKPVKDHTHRAYHSIWYYGPGWHSDCY